MHTNIKKEKKKERGDPPRPCGPSSFSCRSCTLARATAVECVWQRNYLLSASSYWGIGSGSGSDRQNGSVRFTTNWNFSLKKNYSLKRSLLVFCFLFVFLWKVLILFVKKVQQCNLTDMIRWNLPGMKIRRCGKFSVQLLPSLYKCLTMHSFSSKWV